MKTVLSLCFAGLGFLSMAHADSRVLAQEGQKSPSSLVHSQPSESALKPRLVLLMDDLGYVKKLGDRALALEGDITYAVLPLTPYANYFSKKVTASGRELMAHIPMANSNGKALGPGGLTLAMDKREVQSVVREVLDNMPEAAGINNHMGSALTEKKVAMEWIIEVLKERDLYFVDSVTTLKTQGWKTAKAEGIPYLKRHVFLDHVATEAAIGKQFERAIRLAKKHGFAVAIGHPYKETLVYLEKALPALEERGLALTHASEVAQPVLKQALAQAAKKRHADLDVAKNKHAIPAKFNANTDG